MARRSRFYQPTRSARALVGAAPYGLPSLWNSPWNVVWGGYSPMAVPAPPGPGTLSPTPSLPAPSPMPPPGPFPPGCPPNYYPPGCGTCPPYQTPEQQRAYAEHMAQAYNEACRQDAAIQRRGNRAEALTNLPQIPLGVASVDMILAGALQNLPATASQVPMCLTSFVVPRSIAPFFTITSIEIGRQQLLANGAEVPADVFTSDATKPLILEFPQIQTSQQVLVSVRNIDGAPHGFIGTFFGIPGPGNQGCF